MRKIREIQRDCLDTIVRRYAYPDLEKRAESFTALFEKYLSPKSHVLDVGGGWGFYVDPLNRRGHEATVLDVIKPSLQRAPVVVYPGGRFPFPDKSFDASILITMLHHCPDPEAILREARRVTRDVVIVVEDVYHHALGRFWTVLRDRLYNFEFFGHPCQFRKKEEWQVVFEKLGFLSFDQQNVYTKLAGLSILNGVFALKVRK